MGGSSGCGCSFIFFVIGGFVLFFVAWPIGVIILSLAALIFMSGGGRKSANKQAAVVRQKLSGKRIELWGENAFRAAVRMKNWFGRQSRTVKIVLLISAVALSCYCVMFLRQEIGVSNQNPSATEQIQTAVAALFSQRETAAVLENQTQTPIPNQTDLPLSSETTNYEIVFEIPNHRYDGGKTLYVLINQIDLSSDDFKNDIRIILQDIVAQEGNKISVEIHDSRATLDLSYKQYGDFSLGRPLTQSELDNRAIHLIASYDGDLETMIYVNTLMFFPGAFTDTPNVGIYVEEIEFDARK